MSGQIPEKDLLEFKKMVKSYLEIDNNIDKLNKVIKEQREKRNNVSDAILGFMKKHEIKDLATEGGKIRYCVSNTYAPINKDYLSKKVSMLFEDPAKAQKALEFLMDREKVEKVSLRRFKPSGSNDADSDNE